MSEINKTERDIKFDLAILHILNFEGGLSNHTNDRGGTTKFGISKKSYPNLDISNLTLEQAKDIYKRDYWQPYPYKDIVDIDVATTT